MRVYFFSSVFVVSLSASTLEGCAPPGENSSPDSPTTTPANVIQPSQEICADVNQKIHSVLSASPPCNSMEVCETVTVSFRPKPASSSSLGQRILVIDSGMLIPAYTRYKSRVLDHLAIDQQGYYRSSPQKIQVTRPIFEVLCNILDEQCPLTTAKQLNPISDLFYKHKKILQIPIGHGDLTFATLADLNPKADFVIAELADKPAAYFCSSSDDPVSLESYRLFIRNAADSLRSAIEKHNINFVNMSFGDTQNTLKRTWQLRCAGKALPSEKFFLDFQKMHFHNFYEPLFAMEDVVFVQAAPQSTRVLEKLDPEFFSDCQDVSSRIVAAGFSSQEALLPFLGSNSHPLLPNYIKGAMTCTDLAINFGVSAKRPYEDGPFPVLTTMEGVGAYSIGTRPSSSTAAPIVLSYLIYLKNSGLVAGSGREFVANVKNYHQGKLVEPERYRQFEIYRLGRQ